MKKVIIFLFIFVLSACSKPTVQKTPDEILLSIKDYSCKMQILSTSNKNVTNYSASQTYSSAGQYSMEFLDKENLKINYENSILKITSSLFENNFEIQNYKELNQNPLFLSYFIHTYFNLEESSHIEKDDTSIHITLPNYNNYIHSAKLTFNNNLPYTLTYFDENGNEKVNIIYNEFTLI